MNFIEELLEGGGNYSIKRIDGGASLEPASERESDLQSFQGLVRKVRARDGDGYRILKEHKTSDLAEDFVDRVIVETDDERGD